MATNVLLLPQLAGSWTIASNADWRVTLLFEDVNGNPLDLTGIAFRMQVRPAGDASTIAIDLASASGTLVNGGTTGTLSWAASARILSVQTPGAYVADLLAEADGAIVNLFSQAPATLTVNPGVTTP